MRTHDDAAMTPGEARRERAALAALTPEARDALGAAEIEITRVPFRVGRESRAPRRAAARVVMERRRAGSRPNNDLYLVERDEPLNVSREHFQIEHNGSQWVLIDRQSSCGTIVEGQVIGGKHAGGAAPLRHGDVIIVGTSSSRFAFKFRAT
jgi:pSer/pThr/pTyr-binding forkhead associated (FHA) protein